jgi:hypothetical protein
MVWFGVGFALVVGLVIWARRGEGAGPDRTWLALGGGRRFTEEDVELLLEIAQPGKIVGAMDAQRLRALSRRIDDAC